MGLFDKVKNIFNKDEDTDEDADTWYNKGNEYYELGKYNEAIKCYDKALQLNPNYAEVWNNKGAALDDLGKYKEAIKCYDKALQLNPNNANARNNKGLALGDLGKYNEAIKCYDKALEIDPNNELAKNNKKIAQEKLNNLKEKSKTENKSKTKMTYSKPELSLNLGIKTFKINSWKKVPITIDNKGEEIKNVNIKIPDDDFDIRRLKQFNVEKNSSKTVEVYINPKVSGEIPLDIDVEYDYNNKKYSESYFFEILVEENNTSKFGDIKQPSDFTPRPLSTSSLPPELAINYNNIQLIGQGGFARVFKAIRIKDNKPVAIKIPISLDQNTGKSFIKELENWTNLNHQNIVKVYDYNILPIPYFEMELCNTDLNEYSKTKKLSIREASFLIFNTAEGLKYAHNKKIIHRDLKPHNILLKDGIPKISDWGLSRVVSQSTSTTRGGFTPYYAAPEQMNGGHKDERTDIWQMGVIFYQLTTSNLPFNGDSLIEIGMNITNKEPTQPKELNPNMDNTLNNIILKCLNKKPKDRYQSVLQLQRDLANYLQISFKEELTKSITKKDFSRSAFYCGDLALLHLKSDNGVEAYKYLGDLENYANGDIKNDLTKLKEAVKYRVENNISIPYEIVASAELLSHKIKLGFKCD
ncbi:protein kinase domain-containing protein [Methanococcus aeolicus]|uniref:protein kinase domain-containing protein n=1 Tax=Methanococcus aeolicus TaxID=42879 RepID=UPI0021C6BCB0|nr:protein kinase [Methanococcus aeolicus]UXM84179.1 protein kinase [Methanococcus aeolicus]